MTEVSKMTEMTVCAECGAPYSPPVGLYGTNDCVCRNCNKCYAAVPASEYVLALRHLTPTVPIEIWECTTNGDGVALIWDGTNLWAMRTAPPCGYGQDRWRALIEYASLAVLAERRLDASGLYDLARLLTWNSCTFCSYQSSVRHAVEAAIDLEGRGYMSHSFQRATPPAIHGIGFFTVVQLGAREVTWQAAYVRTGKGWLPIAFIGHERQLAPEFGASKRSWFPSERWVFAIASDLDDETRIGVKELFRSRKHNDISWSDALRRAGFLGTDPHRISIHGEVVANLAHMAMFMGLHCIDPEGDVPNIQASADQPRWPTQAAPCREGGAVDELSEVLRMSKLRKLPRDHGAGAGRSPRRLFMDAIERSLGWAAESELRQLVEQYTGVKMSLGDSDRFSQEVADIVVKALACVEKTDAS